MQNTVQTMPATHVAVQSLTSRVEGVSLKVYMNSFSSFPDLFHDLHKRASYVVDISDKVIKGCQELLTIQN
jgi:hypothetical protein